MQTMVFLTRIVYVRPLVNIKNGSVCLYIKYNLNKTLSNLNERYTKCNKTIYIDGILFLDIYICSLLSYGGII